MEWTIDIIEVGIIPHLPMSIYIPEAGPSEFLDVPCYCYLLTGGGAPLLIDTGPDPIASARSGFTVLGDARASLAAALARRGLTTENVPLVVQSHLHYDHMQNAAMFPTARILVQRTELEWACSTDPGPFYVGIKTFRDEVQDRLELLEGDTEVVPGVNLILNRGHSPGHQSVLVQTPDRPVCLCIDIIPLAANVEIVPPSVDDAGTRAFMERVRTQEWEIIPGHDPALRTDVRYWTPA